jgi:hypothetical protein
MLGNSHIFSNLILSATGIFIFYKYYYRLPVTNRILCGIFILSISLHALIEMLALTNLKLPDNLPTLASVGERTIGAVCLVSATWCLVMRYRSENLLLFSTIGLGLLLFYCIIQFRIEFMGLIIQPFCIIVTLLISCLGLGNKQKNALWIIFSMMLLAIATKAPAIAIPMDPVDINRYLLVLALVCFGNAIRDQYKILF